MGLQKGPGEGYMAAKADVLKLCPDAVCFRVNAWGGVTGYVVFRDGRVQTEGIGSGSNSRAAWNDALAALEAEREKAQPTAKTSPKRTVKLFVGLMHGRGKPQVKTAIAAPSRQEAIRLTKVSERYMRDCWYCYTDGDIWFERLATVVANPGVVYQASSVDGADFIQVEI